MSEKLENPPAFPLHPGINPDWTASAGATLRDVFAWQALPVVADTYPEWQLKAWFGGRTCLTREEIRAKAAYEVAEAMLRAGGEQP